ncbi:hypothetical protein HMPREF9123_2441 [Neisseria bacilliformis ATCC BAA-1200]|uniref:Uncharacterized protein n=1 Tax=Neisseria bacilliformis ATCC BAA-1200 TaxID=888742 RepID=F2BFD4_9NEIS|nr:hypothetical protein HMPREF9123_2441 [Neisseria bacilliformis ATCC BAA-1200]
MRIIIPLFRICKHFFKKILCEGLSLKNNMKVKIMIYDIYERR